MSEFALIFLMGPGCREKRRHAAVGQDVFSVFGGVSGRHGGLSGGCVGRRETERAAWRFLFFPSPSSSRAAAFLSSCASLGCCLVKSGLEEDSTTSHISSTRGQRMGYAVGSEYEYHD
jgi:hypothetical protein